MILTVDTDRLYFCLQRVLRTTGRGFLCLVVSQWMLFSNQAWAQGNQADEDPDRRRILFILEELKEITPENYSRLANEFDFAWALAVRTEDPLLSLSTDREQSLKPGTNQVDAGARYRLAKVFQNSPLAFQKVYRNQVKSVAESAFNQALQSADLSQAEAVAERFLFTEVANQALQHLVQSYRSRGEYLQAAFQHNRWMNLQQQVDNRHRIFQIQLWYQAGLPQEGLDDLDELLQKNKPSQQETLQEIARVFASNVPVPNLPVPKTPVTRDHLETWMDELIARANQNSNHSSSAIEAIANNPGMRNSLQPLGNSRRNVARPALESGQLKTAWQQSTFSCLEAVEFNLPLAAQAKVLRQDLPIALSRNSTVSPIASPLVIGNRLIFRCAMNIRAVDLESGEPLWESFLLDRHLKSLLENSEDPRLSGFPYSYSKGPFGSLLKSHWIQTNTAGQLTSDGRTVFAVEEVMSETLREDAVRLMEASRFPSNYLRAYDVETGQLRAQAGGTVGINGDSGAVNPLAGMYFLGAPLVLGDRIYVIAEAESGIYLMQLQATPLYGPADEFQLQPVFSQLLSIPRFPLREHTLRSKAGIVPSYGRGLIICSTCDEHIIAISADDHSVRWIYRYPTTVAQTEMGAPFGVIGGAHSNMVSDRFDRHSRWTDCLPRIVNNRIIVTPRDSDELLCLDLQTGEELWAVPRGRYRTVASVDRRQVVVAGRDLVSALDLSTGKVLWSTTFRDGYICGNGFSDGSVLQLPTSRPGILAVRLSDGRQLLHHSVEQIPGNLYSDGKSIISQGLTDIQSLTKNADGNPQLLQARKELLNGNLAGATVMLKSVIQSASDSADRLAAKEQFVSATLRGLKAGDPVAAGLIDDASDILTELRSREKLVSLWIAQGFGIPPVSPEMQHFFRMAKADMQWAELQELETQNRLNSREVDIGIIADQAVKLLRNSSQHRSDVLNSDSKIIRKERVVMQQIRTAIKQRNPAEQQSMKKELTARLVQELNLQTTPSEIHWWLNACMVIDVTSPASRFINSNPQKVDQLVPAFLDLILRRHMESDGTKSDVRQLLEKLSASRQKRSIVDLLQTIRANRNWHDQKMDGRPKGRLLSEGWLSEDVLSEADLDQMLMHASSKSTHSQWQGRPTARPSDAHSASPPGAMDRMGSVSQDFPVFGSNNQYRHWSFLVESTPLSSDTHEAVNAYDEQGQLRWSYPIPYEPQNRFRNSNSRNPTLRQYVVGYGQLLLIRRLKKITMLDCSKASLDAPPTVLWSRTLPSPKTGETTSSWERTTVYDRQPTGLAPAGSISEYGVPFIVGSELFLVDTITGAEQWHIPGLPEDCFLTTRGDRLYVMSQSSSQIEIRSLVDGQVIDTKSLPDWWRDAEENSTTTPRYFELDETDSLPFRIQVFDGQCILYRYGVNEVTVESYDLDTSTLSWSRTYPGNSSVSNVCGGVVAVLSEGDQLQLLNIATGGIHDVATLPIKSKDVQYLYLRRSANRWIVLTDCFTQDHGEQNTINQGVMINGAIHGLAATDGKLMWSHPAEFQGLRIRRPGSGQPAIPPVAPLIVLLKRPSPPRSNRGFRIAPTVYQAEVRDVDSGEIVFSDSDVGRTLSGFYMKLKPDEKKIILNFDKRSVTFDYTKNASEKRPSNDDPQEPDQ